MSRACLILLLAFPLTAQNGLVNGDFEQDTSGWSGAVGWIGEGCTHGKGCAEVTPASSGNGGPGILNQSLDATPYRNHTIRYRAAVWTSERARAGLWLRVDRTEGRVGFFDNMQSRPIVTLGNWSYFEINGFVHPDAQRIFLGLLAYNGSVRIDDASLVSTGEYAAPTVEAAHPLTDAGLRNLTAFAKLYGLVRFFHPSDEAAAADWNRFAIEGVHAVETPATSAEFVAALQKVFEPVAPTVRVFIGTRPPMPAALTPKPDLQVIRWQNHGFGVNQQSIYHSRRVKDAAGAWKPEDVYAADLGGGVKALVPIALFTNANGTLPAAAHPAESRPPTPVWALSANDRATRLADVVIAWNIFRHFYPYFDVAGTDWDALLPAMLKQAAIDNDEQAFYMTIRKLVAALKDGHGNVMFGGAPPMARPPATAVWIDNKYIVTGVDGAATDQVKPGDEIVSIGGKPAKAVIENVETLISAATPQWKRYRAENSAMECRPRETISLTVKPFGASETKEVKLTCGITPPPPRDTRPAEITKEVAPGIWYFDLTRAQDADFTNALPSLEKAKGIIFDMRGYPRVSAAWFSYVTKAPLRSAQWHVPLVNRPGEMQFEREGEWNLQPREPYLGAKKAWLTDGSAISYAESTMGIVEAYKLGEIVGEPTAGTNGNVNPFELPGGFTISWTGMKVLKQDGSRHHGVGIQPTAPIARTQAGVAAGRDEVLERAVGILK